jgi:antitoxin component YwqK of YwqJK toxin-antitoxin module
MRRSAIAVALFAIALVASQDGRATDPDFACPSGTALREHGLDAACETPAGVGEGPFWSRRTDGSLRLWGEAKDDVPHGAWIQFHPNGEKAIETQYRGGELHGSFQQWNLDGRRVYAGRHDAAGEMHGTWTRWWPNGHKRVEWEMQHGRTDGGVTAWWESGEERFRGQRADGVKQGSWIWWDETGSVSARCRYQRGEVIAGTCGVD